MATTGQASRLRRQRLRPLRHVLVWVVSVAMVALIGALGFRLIEHWSLIDSLYMAVITLTTVGFKEIHPLSTTGQVWTMLLSIAAIGIIFGTVGVVAESIMAEVANGNREVRRMQKTIDAMQHHFFVCGFGRVGSLVAQELTGEGERVVVIDVGEESLQRALDAGYPVVHGNGTTDDVLRIAGVDLTADPYAGMLAHRLGALHRAGVPIAEHLAAAVAKQPLPSEQPAAALWWRLTRHLAAVPAPADAHIGQALVGHRQQEPPDPRMTRHHPLLTRHPTPLELRRRRHAAHAINNPQPRRQLHLHSRGLIGSDPEECGRLSHRHECCRSRGLRQRPRHRRARHAGHGLRRTVVVRRGPCSQAGSAARTRTRVAQPHPLHNHNRRGVLRS